MKREKWIVAVVAVVFVLAPAAALRALQGPVNLSPDGTSPDLSGFVFGLSDIGGCTTLIAGSVTSDTGGGSDTFTMQITDEGGVVASQDFSVPADGAGHPVSWEVHFDHLLVNGNYGLTVLDPGGLGTVTVPDFVTMRSCATQSIPTLSGTGLAGFGALLAAAALVVLVRQRQRG